MKKFNKPTTKNEIKMWEAANQAIIISLILGVLAGLTVGLLL